MMSKLTKNIGLCGASILIVFDVLYIWDCFSLKSTSILNHLLNNMVPCGLVLGIFAFWVLLEKPNKKIFGIASVIVFGIFAVLRFIAGIFFVYHKIKIDSAIYSFDELLKFHGLDFIKFVAFVPMLVSAAFLVIYVLSDKMKKPTQIVGSIAIIALACVWLYSVYQLVSFGMDNSHNIVQIYMPHNLFQLQNRNYQYIH